MNSHVVHLECFPLPYSPFWSQPMHRNMQTKAYRCEDDLMIVLLKVVLGCIRSCDLPKSSCLVDAL
jgi:hypothetical protein